MPTKPVPPEIQIVCSFCEQKKCKCKLVWRLMSIMIGLGLAAWGGAITLLFLEVLE